MGKTTVNYGQDTKSLLGNYPSPYTREFNHADYQCELLRKYVADFENDLDDEHEVGIQLASFGKNITMHVINIGYANPSMIIFNGYINGKYSELYQHVSQLNFLLTSCPKSEPQKPPRRIGFTLSDK